MQKLNFRQTSKSSNALKKHIRVKKLEGTKEKSFLLSKLFN